MSKINKFWAKVGLFIWGIALEFYIIGYFHPIPHIGMLVSFGFGYCYYWAVEQNLKK